MGIGVSQQAGKMGGEKMGGGKMAK